MMSKRIVLVFAFLLTVCMAAGFQAFAGQSGKKRALTYTETLLAELDPGITTESNGNVHIRGARYLWYVQSSDSRLGGYFGSVYNANLDATGTGHIWGTWFSTDDNGDPVADGWEGTWSGNGYDLFPDLYSNFIVKFEAHGIGDNEGLKLESTDAHDYPYSSVGLESGKGAGQIIDNGD